MQQYVQGKAITENTQCFPVYRIQRKNTLLKNISETTSATLFEDAEVNFLIKVNTILPLHADTEMLVGIKTHILVHAIT